MYLHSPFLVSKEIFMIRILLRLRTSYPRYSHILLIWRFKPCVKTILKVFFDVFFYCESPNSRYLTKIENKNRVPNPLFFSQASTRMLKKCPTAFRSTLFHRNRTSAFVTTPVGANVYVLTTVIAASIAAEYPGSRFRMGRSVLFCLFQRVRPITSRTQSISFMGLE